MHGDFDFNRTPLAPPGTKVLIHEKTDIQQTWAPHAVEGWYLGPSLRHYRCYHVWAWATNAERVADTLAWFPTTVIMPRHSSTDIIIATAHDLAQALLHTPPTSSLLPIHDNHRQRLRQPSDIFSQHTGRPDIIPSEDPPPSPAALPTVQPHPSQFIQPPPPVLPTMAAPPVALFPARWGQTRTRLAPAAPLPATAPTAAPLPRVVPLSTMAPSQSPLPAAPQSPQQPLHPPITSLETPQSPAASPPSPHTSPPPSTQGNANAVAVQQKHRQKPPTEPLSSGPTSPSTPESPSPRGQSNFQTRAVPTAENKAKASQPIMPIMPDTATINPT
jgi:hypothetical protein